MGSSRKSKKKEKDKKKIKKKRRSSSSSSDRSSSSSSSRYSSDEWIEAGSSSCPTKRKNEEKPSGNSEQRDEWMSTPLEFSGFTRDQLKKKKEPKDDENKYMLDRLGQSDRELNPYWKDGGSGLPQVVKDLSVSGLAVGDHGVEWLRKALRRAKEQAAEENRRLEDVVAERWGSLEKLESMIKDAESKSKERYMSSSDNRKYFKYKNNSESHGKYNKGDVEESYKKSSKDHSSQFLKDERSTSKRSFMKPCDDDNYYSHRDKRKDDKPRNKYADDDSYRDDSKRCKESKSSRSFIKPSDGDENDDNFSQKKNDKKNSSLEDFKDTSRNRRLSKCFKKPSEEDDDDDNYLGNAKKYKQDVSRYSSSVSSKGWRKKSESSSSSHHNTSELNSKEEVQKNLQDEKIKIVDNTNDIESSQPVFLSADERNELAAKLIKAEIMGNTELVKKLKSRLEEARSNAAEAEQTVILTRTDAKGFTQPLSLSSKPQHGKSKKEKTQTHEQGKRVRYFADDDKYSLQDMFEREKRSTVEDQNEMFARLASKNVGRDESARDMDDVFEDMVRVKESDGKAAARERNKAIEQHRRSSQAIDNCQWCLDGKRLLKHLVITIGNKIFLCLPPYESLTEGHCLLVPSQHVTCATQVDEDVWEELQVFRKALVQMFLSMDLDVVFFEVAMHLSHTPHMVWQCIPLPKETGDLAPIYFKKAILECETEWASNKKLVDLAGKNVRRAIPRGLPYFTVDFGMQSGFAHVIEDEKAFPKNFAQEIIGGMLDADHSLWRKPKFQKFEEQRKKVLEFTKWWQPFNCMKQESSLSN